MAKLPSSFSEEQYDDMGTFDLLPEGSYHCVVEDSDYKENKAKTGHFLEFKYKVVSGEFVGRTFFGRMNLDNPNKTAVDLANKELATLLRALGRTTLDDSEEIHGEELTIVLTIKKGTGDNPDNNNIKKYLPLEGAEKPVLESEGDDEAKPAAASKTKRKPVFEDEDD